jgi:hypothetical protein
MSKGFIVFFSSNQMLYQGSDALDSLFFFNKLQNKYCIFKNLKYLFHYFLLGKELAKASGFMWRL